MLKYWIILFSLCSFSTWAAEIRPFTSDGCSAFPDGTFEQNELWLSCCRGHDYTYWKGGTYDQRVAADEELESCVAQVGEPEIAALMLGGVRVGGTPYLPTRFRWGYGWPYPRGYKALTEDELAQIRALEDSENRINTRSTHGID
ncbi:FAD-binding oxidoreductase [Aliidiomarina sp. B3213]|uniref:FAD-binding oxidoreductase n=1 Tax=Aliidiomarina sp. B3213 TaxID=2249757 RepID=UPI000DD0AFF8|nr:FAD-binding oxidoreductase [Aliidiomarina sp. B3213]RTE86968.1 FAD-binding oxidoreductase [Aliidiomarina sp. B3213]TCZ93242.1 FAD-binding oxidoreductase [Lysobacter sp. N42]